MDTGGSSPPLVPQARRVRFGDICRLPCPTDLDVLIMPKPPSTWKNLERWVAKYYGGERTHWALEDARAQGFAIECKHGKQIPKTILKWWAQAQTNASGRVPMLVMHPLNWPMDQSLVCVDAKTFKELLSDSRNQEPRDRGD